MCMNSAEWEASNALFSTMRKQRTKRSRIRIHRLTRRKQQRSYEDEVDMELKNLKLYMKNISILEENDKLRKKASLLHQENLALMSEFQKKFSSFDPICTK